MVIIILIVVLLIGAYNSEAIKDLVSDIHDKLTKKDDSGSNRK